MPRTVVGIDAGATKTVCILADEDGRVLAEARGGGANLAVDGELNVEKTLHSVIEEVQSCANAGPAAVCLGIAGVDRPDDERLAHSIVGRLGYGRNAIVVNDAVLALVAGAGMAPGIVVISGTGSIVYGRNGSGQAARSGGWGHLLADEGSGYWIGLHALRAVMREADGRGPSTRLTAALLAHFNCDAASDLIHVVYYRDLRRQDIAALSELVERCSEEGDAVASGILDEASEELAMAVRSVVSRLRLADDAFVCVLSGGVFRGAPGLAEALRRRVIADAPNAFVKVLDVEPAVGAVRLAVEHLKGSLKLPVYVR